MLSRPRPPGLRPSALLATVLVCVAAPELRAQRACSWVEGTRGVQGVTIAGLGQIFYISRPRIRCADGVFMSADSAIVYPSQSRTELMGNVRFRDAFRELRSDEARYFSQQARLQATGHLFVEDTIRGSQIENGALVLLRQTEFRDEEEMTVTRGVDGLRPRARMYLQPAADSAAGESPPESDAREAVADSLALPPDSIAPAADSLGPPGDSTALAGDSLTALPDSAEAADSVAAMDSARVAADSPTVPRDSAGLASGPAPAAPPEPDTVPYVVVADRLFLKGESLFQAHGSVEITRDSLRAYADSTRYEQMAGLILLQGGARVDGDGYDLVGRDIDLGVPEGVIRTVRATRDGVLTGDRLTLRAPVIELFLTDGSMDRLIATPLRPLPGASEPLDDAERALPVAEAEEFTLTADSIEVVAPAEVLDHITAVGGARGVSRSRDSLNVEALPEAARHDWLEGDTVVATFVPVEAAPEPPAPDSAAGRRYQLDRLVASGAARSVYRLAPSDSAAVAGTDPPAVHYVTGDVIVIVLTSGQVERMEVEGRTHGYHLEPAPRVRAGDTVAAPDTSAVPPDTTGAVPLARASPKRPGERWPERSSSLAPPALASSSPVRPGRRRSRR